MAVAVTILVALAVAGTVTAAAAALVAMLVTLAAAVAIAGGTLDLLDLAGEERIEERVAVAGAAGADGDAHLVESVDGTASSADTDAITASLPISSSSSFIFQPPGTA